MDKAKKIKKPYNTLFSKTQVSDLFLRDFLPELDPLAVKIYLYCLYLSGLEKEYTYDDIARLLSIEKSLLMEKLIELGNHDLVSLEGGRLALNDINDQHLNKFYRKITSIRPDASFEETSQQRERNRVSKLISDRYFNGMMPPSWYQEIDLWFVEHGFSTDVMYMLFEQCYQNNALTSAYVRKVVSDWAKHNIKDMSDLEVYLKEFENFKSLTYKIRKKLRLGRNLTEYEEEIVKKWHYTYKYDFEIIDFALKKTANRVNFSINTFDNIISQWFQNGLTSLAEIENYEEERKKKYGIKTGKRNEQKFGKSDIPQKKNYKEREYDSGYFDDFLFGKEEE